MHLAGVFSIIAGKAERFKIPQRGFELLDVPTWAGVFCRRERGSQIMTFFLSCFRSTGCPRGLELLSVPYDSRYVVAWLAFSVAGTGEAKVIAGFCFAPPAHRAPSEQSVKVLLYTYVHTYRLDYFIFFFQRVHRLPTR